MRPARVWIRTVVARDRASQKHPVRVDKLERARRIAVSLATIFAALLATLSAALFSAAVVRDAVQRRLILEPLTVPTALANEGLTGDVVAQRIVDQVRKMQRDANRALHHSYTLPIVSWRKDPDLTVTLPIGTVPTRLVAGWLRSAICRAVVSTCYWETRWGGEVTSQVGGYEVRLRRLSGSPISFSANLPRVSERADDSLSLIGAQMILMNLAPLTYAASLIATDLPEAEAYSKRLLKELRRGSDRWIKTSELLALVYLRSENYVRAEAVLRDLLLWPIGDRQSVVKAYLGVALSGQGKRDEAITTWTEVTKGSPNLPMAWVNLCREYSYGGDPMALETCQDVADRYPRSASPRESLARIYLSEGRLANALSSAELAVELSPYDLASLNTLANIQIRRRDGEGAIATLEEALRLDPKNSKLLFNMGRALFTAGRYESCAEVLEKLVLQQPEHAAGVALLSRVLVQIGRIEEALINARRAVQLRPNDVSNHLHLGIILGFLNMPREGLVSIARAIEVNPAAPETPKVLISILRGILARREVNLQVSSLATKAIDSVIELADDSFLRAELDELRAALESPSMGALQ